MVGRLIEPLLLLRLGGAVHAQPGARQGTEAGSGNDAAARGATRVGVELGHRFEGEKIVLTPTVSAAWKHEFADTQFKADARLGHGPQTFVLKSVEIPRDMGEFGVSLKAELAKTEALTFALEGRYELGVADRYTGHTFSAAVKLEF